MGDDLKDLLLSYDHLDDRTARLNAESRLSELVTGDESLKTFVAFVKPLALSPKATAATDLIVLIEWICVVLKGHKSEFELLDLAGKLLEKLLTANEKPRERQLKSVLRSTRTSLSSSLSVEGLEYILAKPASLDVCLTLAILAGSAVDVMESNPAPHSFLIENDVRVFQLYAQAILGSKNALSEFICNTVFEPLLADYMNATVFASVLEPAITKSLLRAPEVMLIHIIPSIFRNLSPLISMDEFLLKSLLNSFVSCFSSSKQVIRDGATKSLILCINHHTSDSAITEKLIALLSKTSSADVRALYGKIIAVAPSGADISKLATVLSRESSDIALEELALAYFVQSTSTSAIVPCVEKGFKEKKFNLRRAWIVGLGRAVLARSDIDGSLYSNLLKFTFDEASSNASLAATNKTAIGAFMYCAFTKKTIPSELLSLKVLPKFEDSDIEWLVRALLVTSPASEGDTSYGVGWIFACCLAHSSQVRLFAVKSLEQVYPQVGDNLVDAVLQLYDEHNVSPVLGLLEKKEHLIKTIVPAHHKNGMGRNNSWIQRCLRVQVDPGKLVSDNAETMLDDALKRSMSPTTSIAKAACDAVATMCFVDSENAGFLVSEHFKEAFEKIPVFSAHDFVVWKTADGELAPKESNGMKYVESKNSKDYETLKWEESVRKEVAAKKGKSSVSNLSKEDHAQLAEEKITRERVQECYKSVSAISNLIESLSRFPSDCAQEFWLPIVTNGLTASYSTIEGLLGSEVAANLFLGLSQKISKRLGPVAQFIGVATLRLNGYRLPDASLEEEPLLEQTTRILYRLQFLANQVAFDSATVSYFLPLLLKVLTNVKHEEEIEEQVILAFNVLSQNSDQLIYPRTPVITAVLSLLSDNIRKESARECLISISTAIADSVEDSEISLCMKRLITKDSFVRQSVLAALDEWSIDGYYPELYVACFSSDKELASEIWEEAETDLPEDAYKGLVKFLGDSPAEVSKAIATAVKDQNNISPAIDFLADLFTEMTVREVTDKYGVVVRTPDEWSTRIGIAMTFKELALSFDGPDSVKVAKFLVLNLGDDNAAVRRGLLQAGLEMVRNSKKFDIEGVSKVFSSITEKSSQSKPANTRPAATTVKKPSSLSSKKALSSKIVPAKPKASAPKINKDDAIYEAVVILYGALGKNFAANDPRLTATIDRLIQTLAVPSEDVQFAISNSISTLIKQHGNDLGAKVQEYVDVLSDKIYGESCTLAQRRGAAYGMSGFVNGLGLSSLSDYEIIRAILEAMDDKKAPYKREGALFLIECLSQSLGKFFEPYALELLPTLLASFGDTSTNVREATGDAAIQIMKGTTGFGVQKIIPLALENMEISAAWRAKKGSLELLGNMAYLDARELSASLSDIIPEIVSMVNDSHKEVRNTANLALEKFGRVIENPEIQKLVPVLIKAIGEPSSANTEEALDGLLKTKFVHYVDAPSLALIVHVLHRGLKDRSAFTKKKACQIVGNMSILTDANDLLPYLASLTEELEIALVDPVPEARSTAGRALGSLVQKLGEERFSDIIPRFLSILRSPERQGDKLGCAQGLAEVLRGLGTDKLAELLPTILKNCQSEKEYVKAGFMPLMIYLPACFQGSQLHPYLSDMVPVILGGLAENSQEIRDTALKAGRIIVLNYASKALPLLLPPLKEGMHSDNHLIRVCSVELTGDLLFQLVGISGKEEAENVGSSGGIPAQLLEILGEGSHGRDNMLASLFICREDTSGQVRAKALEVWKSLIANTPRMVKDILPSLIATIIMRLASPSDEQRTIAARSLGDLVRRVGSSNALSRLLPTLESTLISSTDSDSREGICVALSELIDSSSHNDLVEHQNSIVNIIKATLIDSSASVRESAAKSFDALQEATGNAVDLILPPMMELMSKGDENAFAAVKEMMSTKSHVVFPVLVPSLLSPPMTVEKAASLGSLATVSGTTLYKRVGNILEALIKFEIAKKSDTNVVSIVDNSVSQVMTSVHSDGMYLLMDEMFKLCKHEVAEMREYGFRHLARFFTESTVDYSGYAGEWISVCVLGLDDTAAYSQAHKAAVSLTSKIAKDKLESLVRPASSAIQRLSVEPLGLSVAKGPQAVLPIFFQGLMYGSSDNRELSAIGMAEVIKRTDSANLKPFVTQMAGPLIRTIGERFPANVKSAILMTLNEMLEKLSPFLRPFLPQLQRTFVRSLTDPAEAVRSRAALALGTFVGLQARIDPLVTELINTAKSNTEDQEVLLSVLEAVNEMIKGVASKGQDFSEASKSALMEMVGQQMQGGSSDAGELHAKKMAILAGMHGALVSKDSNAISSLISKSSTGDKALSVLSLNSTLKTATVSPKEASSLSEFLLARLSSAKADDANIVKSVGKLLLKDIPEFDGTGLVKGLCVALNKTDSPLSTDNKRLILATLRTVARKNYRCVRPVIDEVVEAVFSCVRASDITVKLAAEKAFVEILKLVEGDEIFNEWLSRNESNRSIKEYTQRIGKRLAAAYQARIEAGGDAARSDEIEDEEEIVS